MKKLLLPFFLLGTIAMMLVMTKTGAILKTPEAPMGILNLEFAYSTAKTTPIINSRLLMRYYSTINNCL
jgi:hypothetical protein